MLRELLGIEPQLHDDGSYSPSPLALKVSTKQTTNYQPIEYDKYQGTKNKILGIFTERNHYKMKNGKEFLTGNHPVEALLPMLHLENAGFNFEIATPTGRSAKFETWAFPNKDERVVDIYNKYKAQFAQPKRLEEYLKADLTDYAAVFIPGGHGAMLGLPEDIHVGSILRKARDEGMYTISLCHGPASFLSTAVDNHAFLFDGYEMAAFPDIGDNSAPLIGYLPGKMPRNLGKQLVKLGAKLVNKLPDDTVHRDRKLITGASPFASNKLGILATETLLKELG